MSSRLRGSEVRGISCARLASLIALFVVSALPNDPSAWADTGSRGVNGAVYPVSELEGRAPNPTPRPCRGSSHDRSPTVDAGGDLAVSIDTPVAFDVVIDPEGLLYKSIEWDFGDGSAFDPNLSTTHEYADCGTYDATVTVRLYECPYVITDTVRITVEGCDTNPEPVALEARFVIKEQVRDPETGEITWEPLEFSEDWPIESGLQVLLDGTSSTGAAYYRWRRNGALIGSTPTLEQTFNGPDSFEITLTVYDAGAQNSHTSSMTVYVRQGMQYLTKMPVPTVPFTPTRADIDPAGHLWAISQQGGIGYARITDPWNLPRLSLAPLPPFERLFGVSGVGNIGYVAAGIEGAYVLRASASAAGAVQVSVVRQLTPTELGADWVTDVCATGGGAYLLLGPVSRLAYVPFNAPPSNFTYVDLPFDAHALVCVGDEAILAYEIGQAPPSQLALIDIRQGAPVVQEDTYTLPVTFIGRSTVRNRMFAVDSSGGYMVGNLIIHPSPDRPERAMRIADFVSAGGGQIFAALSDRFFYTNSGFSGIYIGKWDIIHRPAPPSFVEYVDPSMHIIGSAPVLFAELLDPGGDVIPSLIVGVGDFGFATVTP